MAPPKKSSFYERWQSKHARRELITPFNIFAATMVLGMLLMVVEYTIFGARMSAEEQLYAHATVEEHGVVYPEYVLNSLWAKPVPRKDALHLALLHEACLTHKDSVIPHTYGLGGIISTPSSIIDRDDPDLLEKMRKCPDVDIFLPLGIRGHGYCEDSVGYTKYLEARMLPTWAIEMTYTDKSTGETFSYHDLCPSTPMIFLNHYWDGIPDKPEWPLDKPKLLMPNIEMVELRPIHYWSVDAVLCKTAICARRVRAWYQQEGNPKNAVVFYTRHTTSDVALLARERLGDAAIQPKNFSELTFIHAVGTSMQKGTKHVLECWLNRPDLPKLELFIDPVVYDDELRKRFGGKIEKDPKKRVTVHLDKVGPLAFGKMTAENAFFMCTSYQEGYGHYINQARAASAVIITTDVPPMNELVNPQSGVLVDVFRFGIPEQLLGGWYKGDHGLKNAQGMTAGISTNSVCDAVDRVVAMTSEARQALGEQARKQYDIDTNFFAAKMKEVRAFASRRRRQHQAAALRTSAP